MRTIYAEYNINHDSIDVYTSAGYMPVSYTHLIPPIQTQYLLLHVYKHQADSEHPND